jgi:hypothetical protein
LADIGHTLIGHDRSYTREYDCRGAGQIIDGRGCDIVVGRRGLTVRRFE